MCQRKAGAGEETFSKTYLTQIRTWWKYSQVINLPLRLPLDAGWPHNCVSPLLLRSPQEKICQRLAHCWFMNHKSCAAKYYLKTISSNLFSSHSEKLNLSSWHNSGFYWRHKQPGFCSLTLCHLTWTDYCRLILDGYHRAEKSACYPPK